MRTVTGITTDSASTHLLQQVNAEVFLQPLPVFFFRFIASSRQPMHPVVKRHYGSTMMAGVGSIELRHLGIRKSQARNGNRWQRVVVVHGKSWTASRPPGQEVEKPSERVPNHNQRWRIRGGVQWSA
jgi:hypothetical protein